MDAAIDVVHYTLAMKWTLSQIFSAVTKEFVPDVCHVCLQAKALKPEQKLTEHEVGIGRKKR